jgi:hypothetical protein
MKTDVDPSTSWLLIKGCASVEDEKKKKNNGSWKRCLRAGFPKPVEGRRDRCAGWPPDWGQ